MDSQLWTVLRSAIDRLNSQTQRIADLERMVRALEQALRDARAR